MEIAPRSRTRLLGQHLEVPQDAQRAIKELSEGAHDKGPQVPPETNSDQP